MRIRSASASRMNSRSPARWSRSATPRSVSGCFTSARIVTAVASTPATRNAITTGPPYASTSDSTAKTTAATMPSDAATSSSAIVPVGSGFRRPSATVRFVTAAMSLWMRAVAFASVRARSFTAPVPAPSPKTAATKRRSSGSVTRDGSTSSSEYVGFPRPPSRSRIRTAPRTARSSRSAVVARAAFPEMTEETSTPTPSGGSYWATIVPRPGASDRRRRRSTRAPAAAASASSAPASDSPGQGAARNDESRGVNVPGSNPMLKLRFSRGPRPSAVAVKPASVRCMSAGPSAPAGPAAASAPPVSRGRSPGAISTVAVTRPNGCAQPSPLTSQ